MEAGRHTFKKAEILRKKKLIESLQDKKKNPSVFVFPFILTWMKVDLDVPFPAQVLISIPKKNYRKAVDRNRVKRQVKEIYRHQKQKVYNFLIKKNLQVAFMVIFVGKGSFDHAFLKEKMQLLFDKFAAHVEENP